MGPLKESVLIWWGGISLREQRMVIVCAFLLVLGSVYWGVFQPITERADTAKTRINSEEQLLNWVSDKADRIVELRSQRGVSVSNEPFNQVISASAKRYKIDLIRIQPRDDMLQVWIKPIKFSQFVHWLMFLEQQKGIQVEFMDISKSDTEGVIEVKRLQLKRGG